MRHLRSVGMFGIHFYPVISSCAQVSHRRLVHQQGGLSGVTHVFLWVWFPFGQHVTIKRLPRFGCSCIMPCTVTFQANQTVIKRLLSLHDCHIAFLFHNFLTAPIAGRLFPISWVPINNTIKINDCYADSQKQRNLLTLTINFSNIYN